MPLRIVKPKPLVNEKRYKEIADAFQAIASAESGSSFYWDLGRNEKSPTVKKQLLYVAEKEGITLEIKRMRGESSFKLRIISQRKAITKSAANTKKLILKALAKGPLGKHGIEEAVGEIPNFNNHVRALIAAGKITKEGDRRNTLYQLT